MTPAAAQASADAPRLSLRSVLDAWRAIGRRQLVTALGFGVAFFVYGTGGNLLMMLQHPEFGRRPMLLAISLVRDLAAALVLLACVAVAEHITASRTRRAAYIAAIVVSAAIAGPLAMIPRAAAYALGAPGTAQASARDYELDLVNAFVGRFFEWLVLAGAATFVYVDRRSTLIARRRLDEAELARTGAARRTLEARLNALQARVEPQFLFNTLAQVRALYVEDTARGERMLDELIAYLRAAMPKMRDTASTLGQEVELARAYLAIVEVRLGDRLSFSIDAPADCGELRVPPMMLLPLVDHAIGRDPGDGTRSIAIRCAVTNGKLRIEIASRGGSPAAANDDAGMAQIRERLAALYGGAASLELTREPALTVRAVATIPFEAAAP